MARNVENLLPVIQQKCFFCLHHCMPLSRAQMSYVHIMGHTTFVSL